MLHFFNNPKKGVTALINSGLGVKGPNDNWAFFHVDSFLFNVKTYNGNDTLRWVPYWSESKAAGNAWIMSAGQKTDAHFQAYITALHWKIADLKRVYYRDYIFMGVNSDGKLAAVHCKGECWNQSDSKYALTTEIFYQ